MLSRPGRLDGGVQRQHVGLTGDLFDDGDPPGDIPHGGYGFGHGNPTRLGVVGGFDGDLLRLLGVVGILPDVGGHLLHGGRSFFRRRRLLGGAIGEVIGPGAHLLGPGGHVIRG